VSTTNIDSACAQADSVDLGFVELSWLQMAVLGVIQGITELLPISSTAHLRVIPGILGWRDPGSAFSAAMQLASFAAVLVYFRRDIAGLGGATLRAVAAKNYASHDFRVVLGIPQRRHPDILRVPIPAALVAVEWIEGGVRVDAMPRRRSACHQRHVAGISQGGQHAVHAGRVRAVGRQGAQVGDLESMPGGVEHGLWFQTVDRHQHDEGFGGAATPIGHARGRRISSPDPTRQAQDAGGGNGGQRQRGAAS
jgi:hypothetical protein